MKKAIKVTLALVAFILLFLVWWEYKVRLVYYNRDKTKCITVWKTLGGRCYIIPYKYRGIFPPRQNYVCTDNKNNITVVWDKRIIGYDFVLTSNAGYKTYFRLQDYRVKYCDALDSVDNKILDESYYKKYKSGSSIDSMDCVSLDILELQVWV